VAGLLLELRLKTKRLADSRSASNHECSSEIAESDTQEKSELHRKVNYKMTCNTLPLCATISERDAVMSKGVCRTESAYHSFIGKK